MSPRRICPECYQEHNGYWCKPCNSKHFQNDFNNWTSGNDKIDKFIQDTQLNANFEYQIIEWIPYDRFKDVKQIGKGGFGTIHYARWIDGFILEWDIENQQWERYGKNGVADNFVNFNDVLNEMEIHFKTYCSSVATSIRFYGITQDPETHSHMMVLQYAKDGNLREYLKINFNNINWEQKLYNLQELSKRLMNIHELDIVHQDLHPGNILSSNFRGSLEISDFGLSKLIGENLNNPEKNNVVGVLPYIAPEVLSGDEEYTKAADVYSFGIIAYEIITGFPPYPDIPHDEDLAIKICNGLRPKIPLHTSKLITRTIMRCWDARVTHRPTLKELFDDKLVGANPNNPEKKNIVGVLPYIAPEVLSGDEEYTKAADVYSFGIIAYEIITGFPPYPDIPHDEDLAIKICNGLRPKIPLHTSKLITRTIMRCWDARVTHRPTLKELFDELEKYYDDYYDYLLKEKNQDSEIGIQIKKAEEFSANQESTNTTTTITTTPLNYQTHPQAIYTSRLLNYSKLPKPKNEENFERELEELTKSFSHINTKIGIQIKKAEEFSANQESTNTTTTITTTPLNYQTHPQAIYTSRLLNYSKLPKPKNEENFERELEELTKSFSHINTNDDIDEF
ncbi:hypothetical protein Glove_151g57 [Diversispora epigaea]|uniref:Protein kinase domain-containing protein n=1 Tax=Diversispora epigaea TaxID=1348612 RepID=A0A397IWR4_9GLOM|nr:hypothetical protein Glove_151g57 [Diversispora epigaea]